MHVTVSLGVEIMGLEYRSDVCWWERMDRTGKVKRKTKLNVGESKMVA